jgi:hypothetical protein
MLDIETLGTVPGSAILSIGIVDFHPANLSHGLDFWLSTLSRLKVFVSLESCLDAGLVVAPKTLKWWMFQSEQARRDAFDRKDNEVSLSEACRQVREFMIGMGEGVRVWAHGAPFDPPILDAAMRAVGMESPWDFRMLRDTRTIFDLSGIKYSGTHHEPVADATAQAEQVSAAIVALAASDFQPSVAAAAAQS